MEVYKLEKTKTASLAFLTLLMLGNVLATSDYSGGVRSASNSLFAVADFEGSYLGQYQAGSDVILESNIILDVGSRAINNIVLEYEIYGPCYNTTLGLCKDINGSDYKLPIFSSDRLDVNDNTTVQKQNNYGVFAFKLLNAPEGKVVPGQAPAKAQLMITGETSSKWVDGEYHVIINVYDGSTRVPLRHTSFDTSCSKYGQIGCAFKFKIVTAGETTMNMVVVGVTVALTVAGLAVWKLRK